MPAADPWFPQTPSGADAWSAYPGVTPLPGRIASADEPDKAAADALANAIAAFSGGRASAAGAASTAAPSPIRTVGGWRNG